MSCRAVIVLAVLMLAHHADGQASLPPEPILELAPHRFELTLTAGVWVPRLGGEVTLGPSPAADAIVLEEDFQLDSTEAVFNFELAIGKDRQWEIGLSGFDFSTDSEGVFETSAVFGDLSLSPGDAFESSFDLTSAAMEVTFWKWSPIRSGVHEGRVGRVDLRFAPSAGVRFVDVDHVVRLPASGLAEERAGGEWLAPFVGFNLNMHYHLHEGFPLIEHFEILAAAGAGPALGGDGGAIVHLRAGMSLLFSDNFAFTFGYRLVELNVENDDYQLEGGLQGLFFAGTIRF